MEADKSEVHKGEIKKKTVMHDIICIDCIGIAHEIKNIKKRRAWSQISRWPDI